MSNARDVIFHNRIKHFNETWDYIPFSLSFKSTLIIRSTSGREEIKERLHKALQVKGKTLVAVQWKNRRAIVRKIT